MKTHHNGIAPVPPRLLPCKAYCNVAGAADKLESIAGGELHAPVTSEVADTVVQRAYSGNWNCDIFYQAPQLAVPTVGGILPGAIDMVSACCKEQVHIPQSPDRMQDATDSSAVQTYVAMPSNIVVVRLSPAVYTSGASTCINLAMSLSVISFHLWSYCCTAILM